MLIFSLDNPNMLMSTSAVIAHEFSTLRCSYLLISTEHSAAEAGGDLIRFADEKSRDH